MTQAGEGIRIVVVAKETSWPDRPFYINVQTQAPLTGQTAVVADSSYGVLSDKGVGIINPDRTFRAPNLLKTLEGLQKSGAEFDDLAVTAIALVAPNFFT